MQIKMPIPTRALVSITGLLIALFGFYIGGFIMGIAYVVCITTAVYAIYQMFPIYFANQQDFKSCWRRWGHNAFDVIMLIAGLVATVVFSLILSKEGNSISSLWFILLGPACFFSMSTIVGLVRFYLD
jgi:hypothetical protein